MPRSSCCSGETMSRDREVLCGASEYLEYLLLHDKGQDRFTCIVLCVLFLAEEDLRLTVAQHGQALIDAVAQKTYENLESLVEKSSVPILTISGTATFA